MFIKEIYLKNFGCFKERQFQFKEGINIIQGNNGAGKTTLHTFIQGMFFGIEKQRGRQSKKDVYALYEPWEEFANYYGKMRFQIDNRNFLLERSFYRLDKRALLRNEDDGEILSLEQGDLTAILDGLTENSYRNTISIGQLKGETDQSLADELKNYVINFNQTGDSYINIANALQRLEEERKKWELQLKQYKQSRENELMKMNAMLEFMEKENAEKASEYDALREAYNNLQKEMMQKKDAADTAQTVSSKQNQDRKGAKNQENEDAKSLATGFTGISIMIFLIMGISMLSLVIQKSIVYKSISALVLVSAFLLMIILVNKKVNKKTKKKEEVLTEIVIDSEADESRELAWKLKNIQEIMKEKETAIMNCKEEMEEYGIKDEKMLRMEEEINAVSDAAVKIKQAAKKMEEKAGTSFEERASYYLSEITQGKYERLYVTDNLSMSVLFHDIILPLEQVSRGTADLIYFCFRLASAEILYPNVKLPILLDDAFSMCDEERLTRILKLLYQKNRQILLFTCHDREHAILSSLGIVHNYITLV